MWTSHRAQRKLVAEAKASATALFNESTKPPKRKRMGQPAIQMVPARSIVVPTFNNEVKQRVYRQRVIDQIIDIFGPMVFNERQFFTLGGHQVVNGKLVEGCELQHLHAAGLMNKRREGNYISVEVEKSVHAENIRYKGPVWERGTLRSVWRHYSKMKDFFPAVIHADFCFGMKAAKPTIFTILENPAYLPATRLAHGWQSHKQAVLLVINVLKESTWLKSLGSRLNSRPRHGLERMARFQAIKEVMNIDLIDTFNYKGRQVSKMQTMMYLLSPR